MKFMRLYDSLFISTILGIKSVLAWGNTRQRSCERRKFEHGTTAAATTTTAAATTTTAAATTMMTKITG